MSKNKLALFSTPQAKQRSKSKEQVASLKTNNCTLFSRLYIACQARQCNLDSFFEHANQAYPPSISDMGQLRQGSKSDLMEVDIVCMGQVSNKQPETIYHRTHSGTTQRQRVFERAPIPANWEALLRSTANKDELFRYLSDCIHACETGRKVNISTNDETIVSTQIDMSDVEYLQPCSHEEAETRILLHVAHCARQGLRKLVIGTVDTDVVVLAKGHFPAIRLDELWVRFGVGTHFRQIAIQEIVKNVNERA